MKKQSDLRAGLDKLLEDPGHYETSYGIPSLAAFVTMQYIAVQTSKYRYVVAKFGSHLVGGQDHEYHALIPPNMGSHYAGSLFEIISKPMPYHQASAVVCELNRRCLLGHVQKVKEEVAEELQRQPDYWSPPRPQASSAGVEVVHPEAKVR